MTAFGFWYCKRCKSKHSYYCPRFMGRLRFYIQFRGEAPTTWIIKQIVTPTKRKGLA